MGKSSRRRHINRRQIIGTTLLCALTIVTLGVVAFALLRPEPVAESVPAPAVTFTETPKAVPVRVAMADAMKRLDDPARPFVMVILGDSTGADAVSWPGMVGEWISEKYDRPVTMHPWSEGTKPPGYQPPRELGAGTNAAVTIYNGSAPSRNAKYSLTELSKFIPVDKATVDLVIISHGHNQPPNTLIEQVHPLAIALLEQAPQASIVNIIQNPEKVGSPHAEIQENNLTNLRLYSARSMFDVIDVHKAFKDHGDFAALYKDNVHPAGADGYRIWADAVIAALSAR